MPRSRSSLAAPPVPGASPVASADALPTVAPKRPGRRVGPRLRRSIGLAVLLVATGAVPARAASAPDWLPETYLTDTSESPISAQVAVDAAGDATVVWSSADGRVQVRTRPAGGDWLPPESLAAAGSTASNPQIAGNAAGDLVVTWEQEGSGFQRSVYAATRPAGGAWDAGTSISTTTADAGVARVAVDAAGDATAVWSAYDNGPFGSAFTFNGVQAASHPAGGTWKPPVDVSAPTATTVEDPGVAVAPGGDVTVIWTQSTNAPALDVETSTRPTDGGWTIPTTLDEIEHYDGILGALPDVATDSAGGVTAVWQHPTDGFRSATTIMSATRPATPPSTPPAGDAWTPSVTVATPTAGQSLSSPRVAVSAAGTATTIWQNGPIQVPGLITGPFVVQVADRPLGGAWSSATDLSAADEQAGDATLAEDPAGDVTVVWDHVPVPRPTPLSRFVDASSRPAGGTWGGERTLTAPTRKADYPVVGVDDTGDPVAAWLGYDDTQTTKMRVTVAEGDASGPSVDDVQVPATATVGVPFDVSASATDVWSAIVASTWDFGEGSPASGLTATHTYATPGTRSVTLVVRDAAGHATTVTRTITVAPAAETGNDGGTPPPPDTGTPSPPPADQPSANQPPADQPPAKSPSVSAPPVSATPAVAVNPLLCARAIVLTEVSTSGPHVRLSGVTKPSFRGRRVTLTRSKTTIGHAVVQSDGTFQATAAAPSKHAHGTPRYVATLGSDHSAAFKQTRLLSVTSTSLTGTSLRVQGRLTGSGHGSRPLAVVARTGCPTASTVVRSLKTTKAGTFTTTLPRPAAKAGLAVYLVKTTTHGTTQTLPIVVRARA